MHKVFVQRRSYQRCGLVIERRARWSELAGQLRSVAFLPAGFDEKQAYDRSFVPGC